MLNRQGIRCHMVSPVGQIGSWLRQGATRFPWPALLHLRSLSLPLQWRNLGVIKKIRRVLFFFLGSLWILLKPYATMNLWSGKSGYIRLFSLLFYCGKMCVGCHMVPTLFWEAFRISILDFGKHCPLLEEVHAVTDLIDFTDMTSPEVVTTPSCTEEVAGRDVAQKQLQVSHVYHFGSARAAILGVFDALQNMGKRKQINSGCTRFRSLRSCTLLHHFAFVSTSKRNESASQFEVQGHQ